MKAKKAGNQRSQAKPSKDAFELFQTSYNMQIRELQGNHEHIRPDNVRKAAKIIINCKGKLICTGMGKSGLIAQKLSSTFSSIGTPAFFLHPGESLHGDLGVIQKDDVLLVLAKSGESEEVISMLEVVRKMGNKIISILGNPYSTTGKISTVIVRATVNREADSLDLAPTASTTVALVVGDALAATVSEIKEFQTEKFAMLHPAGQLGRSLLLNVEDLLNKDIIPAAQSDISIMKLLEIGAKPNLGGVMIMNQANRLVGLVTDGDIRRGIMKYKSLLNCKITDIMTKDPVCVQVGTRALDALKLMENRHSQISVLPVVDSKQQPVGLLRLHDLLSRL